MIGASTAKYDDIQEGVCTETVGTVDGHGGSLTSGIQTRNNLILAVLQEQERISQ